MKEKNVLLLLCSFLNRVFVLHLLISERFVSALGQCATASVWPLLFTTLTDSEYGGQSIDAVCRCLVDVATGKSAGGEETGDGGSKTEISQDSSIKHYKPGQTVNFDNNPDLPSSADVFARLLVTSLYSIQRLQNTAALDAKKKKKTNNNKSEEQELDEIEIPSSLLLLCTIGKMIHPVVGDTWNTSTMTITSTTSTGIPKIHSKTLPNVIELFRATGRAMVSKDGAWWISLGNALSELMTGLFSSNSVLKAVCYQCLGVVISMVTSSDLPRRWTANMLHSVNHSDETQRYGLASAFEAAAR